MVAGWRLRRLYHPNSTLLTPYGDGVFFVWTELSTSQLEGAQGGAVASVPDPLPDTFKSLSLARLTEKRWTADLTKRWTQRDGHPMMGSRSCGAHSCGERERGVAK